MVADASRPVLRHDRPLLDTIRWVSALLVALGHATALVVRPAGAGGEMPWAAAFHLLAAARDPAVIVFFVLSGYLVGGNMFLRRASFRWLPYAIARTSRIYTVLLPALALAVTLDMIGMQLFPASTVYHAVWAPGALGLDPLVASYTWANLVLTALAATTLFGNEIGTAGPVWSLSLEWIFYFLFPCLVLPFRAAAAAGAALGTAALLSAVVLILVTAGNLPVAAFLLMWCAGAAARIALHHLRVPPAIAFAAGIAAILVFGIAVVAGSGQSRIVVRGLQLLLSLSMALYLSHQSVGERGISRRIDSWLAERSFSLYLVHLPVMTLATAALNAAGILPTQGVAVANGSAALLGIALILLIAAPGLAVSWLFAATFEARTEEVRRMLATLAARIFGSPARPPVRA